MFGLDNRKLCGLKKKVDADPESVLKFLSEENKESKSAIRVIMGLGKDLQYFSECVGAAQSNLTSAKEMGRKVSPEFHINLKNAIDALIRAKALTIEARNAMRKLGR